MNPHGCSMKENENGTSNGSGREFLPHYTQSQTTKKCKIYALLNKVNQGSKLPKREPSWGRRKKQQRWFIRLIQIMQGF